MNFENGMNNWDNYTVDGSMGQGAWCSGQMPTSMPVAPVYECPEERVCHRYICYDVPHACPFL